MANERNVSVGQQLLQGRCYHYVWITVTCHRSSPTFPHIGL